jgi:hypothetical protein
VTILEQTHAAHAAVHDMEGQSTRASLYPSRHATNLASAMPNQ